VGIGETFKQARKERGLSLEEIAEKTKIRRRYLEAIEEENFRLLPGRVYVKGFLRSYAKFLGLNPEPLVALYEERYPGEQPAAVAAEVPVRKEKKVHSRGKPLIYVFLAAVLCLVAFGLYAWRTGTLSSPAPDDAQASRNADGRDLPEQVYAPPDQPLFPPVSPGLEDNAPPQGISLVLDVVQDSCWMRVVVDGETKFEGELTARQTRTFSGKERIKVKLGNAGVVQVQVNGRYLGYLGGRGEVVNKEFMATSDS